MIRPSTFALVCALVFAFSSAETATVADVRSRILAWARWGLAHHTQFHYRQTRPMQYSENLPWIGDCSAFVTFCYKHAGAADPNGLNYNGQGYTGTLLSHGRQIARSEVQPGDIIIYGNPTVHTAVIIEPGDDPLTISMGHEGAPDLIHVNQDGRHPQYYVTCEFSVVFFFFFFFLMEKKSI
jgi:hypothetical protein